jgi:hypothetical protein
MSANEDLRPREARAIDALLTEATIEAAAMKTGVSSRTLRRWLHREDFYQAFRCARGKAMESALQRLQESTGVAVRVLVEIAADESAKPADRLRASNSILDYSIRGAELLAFSERLARLEERSEQNGGLLQ